MDNLPITVISNNPFGLPDDVVEMLDEKAPAALAMSPASHVSEGYSFVPTYKILEVLLSQGFVIRDVVQPKGRNENNLMTAKHRISLRHKSVSAMSRLGNAFPEILLFNSHGWQCKYLLLGGIFRFVCENGMIVADQDFGGFLKRHEGFDYDFIINATKEWVNQVEPMFEKITRMSEIELSDAQVLDFAQEATQIRWEGVNDRRLAIAVNDAQRYEDEGNNLWNTMNRAQENLIRGGFTNPLTGRKVRAINGIDADTEINTKLWQLADRFYESAAA